MLVWIETDLKAKTFVNITDVREIEVAATKDIVELKGADPVEETVYEIRAHFEGKDGYTNPYRIAQYKSCEAAETYHRFMGMTISRSGLKHETGVIVPHICEEDALVLSKKFAGFDADLEERSQRESVRDAEGVKSDEFADAPHV